MVILKDNSDEFLSWLNHNMPFEMRQKFLLDCRENVMQELQARYISSYNNLRHTFYGEHYLDF